MAGVLDAEPSADLLPTKYAELARKYAQLVERLDRRATHDRAVYRIGSFDARVGATALALVSSDEHSRLPNARFVQLDVRVGADQGERGGADSRVEGPD